MNVLHKYILILISLSSFLFSQKIYEIPVGSQENEIEFLVNNDLDLIVNNFTAEPVVIPEWIEITQKASSNQILSGSAGKAYFKFNVIGKPQIDEEATLVFDFKSGNRVIEQRSIILKASLPQTYSLRQNYPNPFNPSTTIEYQLPEKSDVKLVIYNMLGQEVITLVDKIQEAGVYKTRFNASAFASGFYIYKLKTDKKVLTKKMMLIK